MSIPDPTRTRDYSDAMRKDERILRNSYLYNLTGLILSMTVILLGVRAGGLYAALGGLIGGYVLYSVSQAEVLQGMYFDARKRRREYAATGTDIYRTTPDSDSDPKEN